MSLYDAAVQTARTYVGPAAELFISRLVQKSLGLADVRALDAHHLRELAQQCRRAAKELKMAPARADEFSTKIAELVT